jgi:hypothetical protein
MLDGLVKSASIAVQRSGLAVEISLEKDGVLFVPLDILG